MRKTETKEILYCDICGRESSIPLTKCPICSKEGCYTCTSQVYDVYHTNVCEKCLEDETIHAHLLSIWKHWGKERENAIKELQRFSPLDVPNP